MTGPARFSSLPPPPPPKHQNPDRPGDVSIRVVASRGAGLGAVGRLGAERGKPKERSDEVDDAAPGAQGARPAP